MPTETASASTTVTPVVDPNRIITISLKASQAAIIRSIAACLANPLDDSRKSLLKVCDATPENMMIIHHKIYSAENGWTNIDWDDQGDCHRV